MLINKENTASGIRSDEEEEEYQNSIAAPEYKYARLADENNMEKILIRTRTWLQSDVNHLARVNAQDKRNRTNRSSVKQPSQSNTR